MFRPSVEEGHATSVFEDGALTITINVRQLSLKFNGRDGGASESAIHLKGLTEKPHSG